MGGTWGSGAGETGVSSRSRPVLAIVHGEDLGAPLLMAESAAPVCDLAWVIDSSEMGAWLPRLLRKLGTTIDIAGMSMADAAQALRPVKPDGIVAYGDHLIPTASALADRLGLDYYDRQTADRLADKWVQRQALHDGGVPVPRFALVPPRPTREEVDALVARVGFPVVLKPRHGAAGRDTVLIGDAAQLRELLAWTDPDPAPDGAGPAMLVEEYLYGMAPPPSEHFADYVSVESVVAAGKISHLAVTGRFPPAEPFRESGFFIPSDLPAPHVRGVLDVATEAISALGVRTGCLHTEVKLTPDGPRIIEVNGRVGGSIPSMLAIAAGVDLTQLSQRVALGQPVVFDDLVRTDRVGYLFRVQAPQWARRVLSVEGLDRLSEYSGVDTVFLNRQPGDGVDWRKGSHEYVYSVLGAAPDHDALLAVKRVIDEEVTVSYS
jgi:biotin carboxylase